jgi:hypothetical protein
MKTDQFIPPSKAEVQKKFLKFGQAGPSVEDAKDALQAEQAANRTAQETDRANRKRLDEMSADEVRAARTETVLAWMATEPFIRANRNFFTWGPEQHNWKQLLAYFDAMGWTLVDVDQVGRAFRYLLDSGCFQTKEVLQRSESYLRPREFSAGMVASPTVTAAEVAAAKKMLNTKFAGRAIKREDALAFLSQLDEFKFAPEAILDAVQNTSDLAAAKARTTSDLKAEVVGSRRVRSRAEIAAEFKVV